MSDLAQHRVGTEELALLEERNRARETAAVRALRNAYGGAWSAHEASEKTGFSLDALRQSRAKREIVWWADDSGHSHYPKWQFDSNYRVRGAVGKIISVLRSDDPLHVMAAFITPQEGLGDVSLIDLILAGQEAKAIRRAHEMVDGLC